MSNQERDEHIQQQVSTIRRKKNKKATEKKMLDQNEDMTLIMKSFMKRPRSISSTSASPIRGWWIEEILINPKNTWPPNYLTPKLQNPLISHSKITQPQKLVKPKITWSQN